MAARAWLGAILFFATVGLPAATKRLALVIGNAAYPRTPLLNPTNDAIEMYQRLMSLGFQKENVDLKLDVDAKQLARAIERLIREIKPGDLALLYYSGHGLQINGENYLVPIDFDGFDETDARFSGYPMSSVQIGMQKAGISILIFDACRNNPFLGKSTVPGLAPIRGTPNGYIAFATSPGKVAEQTDGPYSRFTTHLLEALNRPGLSLDTVFEYVNDKVQQETKGVQTPWEISTLREPFYFTPSSLRQQERSEPVYSLNRKEPVDTKKALRLFDNGEKLFSQNSWASALPLYAEAVRLDPTNSSYAIKLAQCYVLQGKARFAIPHLDAALELDPHNADAYEIRALAHFELGDLDESLRDYTAAIQIHPDDGSLFAGRSSVDAALGQQQHVIDDDTAAIRLGTKLIEQAAQAYAFRASAYAQLGEHAAAVEDLTKALKLLPKDMEEKQFFTYLYFVQRAVSYSLLGDKVQALSDVSQAIGIQPGIKFNYYMRAEILRNIGDCAAAIADYQRSIPPDDELQFQGVPELWLIAFSRPFHKMNAANRSGPYVGLATCYANQGSKDQAIYNSDLAVTVYPDSSTYNTRGWVYAKFGDFNAAIENYAHALQLNPDLSDAFFNRGVAYASLRRWERAVDNYSEDLHLRPGHVDALNKRASAYLNLGKTQEALDDANKAIALNSDSAEAYNNRGVAYEWLGQKELAIVDFTKAITLAPTIALYYENRGKARRLMHDVGGAIADASRAAEMTSQH